MATIKVMGNYEINIDGNHNHEAREFTKMGVDSKTGEEKPLYRSIGHFNSVPHALDGIYRDMCLKKANTKDSISITEWIEIINKTYEEVKGVFDTTRMVSYE